MSLTYSAPRSSSIYQTIESNYSVFNGVPSSNNINTFNNGFTVSNVQDFFDILIFSFTNQGHSSSQIFDTKLQKTINNNTNPLAGMNLTFIFFTSNADILPPYGRVQFNNLNDYGFSFYYSGLSSAALSIRGIKFTNNNVDVLIK